jgi:hypothetical protein
MSKSGGGRKKNVRMSVDVSAGACSMAEAAAPLGIPSVTITGAPPPPPTITIDQVQDTGVVVTISETDPIMLLAATIFVQGRKVNL